MKKMLVTALFLYYNKNLRTVDSQPVCSRCTKVCHTEKVCRQNFCNQQHKTNLYNSYLSFGNTFYMKGTHSLNKRGIPNNQYMHSKYNPQEDSLKKYD